MFTTIWYVFSCVLWSFGILFPARLIRTIVIKRTIVIPFRQKLPRLYEAIKWSLECDVGEELTGVEQGSML
jgi:hypothetical protein